MTKERPIPFSAPMVRALRDGSKTQTRRIVKGLDVRAGMPEPEWRSLISCCPYGQSGDRLWVREAWRTLDAHDHIPPREMDASYRLWFEADTPHQPGFGKYRPGMFMPRWASRITLEIVSVRVELLQDISRGDAMGEGCPFPNMAQGDDPRQWYADLWEQINGPGSWAANPWVWVIEFKRATS